MNIQSFVVLFPLVFEGIQTVPLGQKNFELGLKPNPEGLMNRALQKFTNRPNDLEVLMKVYLNLMNNYSRLHLKNKHQ